MARPSRRRDARDGGWLAALSSLPVTAMLGAALCLVFLRTVLYEHAFSLESPSVATLMHFGGHHAPLVREGEVWRLGTAVFLHAGCLHIAFNLLGLGVLGAAIESVHGRAWVWFTFLVTGIAGNVLSDVFIMGVGIGASGALCGLMGLKAGWGHREGTASSRELRNRMLRWFGGTMVFGFAIGADNWAHLGGFLSGGVLGLLLPSDVEARMPRLTSAAGLFGLVGCAALFAATMAPVTSARGDAIAAGWQGGVAAEADPFESMEPPFWLTALSGLFANEVGVERAARRSACAAHDAGDDERARTELAPLRERGWTPQMIDAVDWPSFCVRVEATERLCERYPHADECSE